MKGIIVYKGKYGATRQYAAWLRNELQLPLVLSDSCKHYHLEESDTVIVGTSIYVGKMQARDWLHKNEAALQNKKIYLFVVCGTPASELKKLQEYLTASVPASLLPKCKVYFLPGRLVYRKLSLLDKFVLKMGAMMAKDPVAKKKMLTDYNNVRRENLSDLIEDIKKISAPASERVMA